MSPESTCVGSPTPSPVGRSNSGTIMHGGTQQWSSTLHWSQMHSHTTYFGTSGVVRYGSACCAKTSS